MIGAKWQDAQSELARNVKRRIFETMKIFEAIGKAMCAGRKERSSLKKENSTSSHHR